MIQPRILAGGVLLLAATAGLFLWQQKAMRGLRSENSALRQAAQELEGLREENARLAQEHIEPAELERLRDGQLELARLRGQVAQLRRQVAEVASKRPAPAPVAPAATEAAAPLVETFTATAQAPVPWKQTLITGGWTLPSGKRALVLVQPNPVEGGEVAQIELETRIIEVPETALGQMGMEMVKAGEKKSSFSGVLTSEQMGALMKVLEQVEGVKVLAAPKVLTADGRQAQVKVAEAKTSPSGENYEVGPTIDLVPTISADRASVDLTVSVQLKSDRIRSE